jgi:transglutaminase-like putative cysteine protease
LKIEGYLPTHTTDDALQAMIYYTRREYLHPQVQELAQDIVAGIHPSDQTSQMIAIIHWIKNNIKYVKDEVEAARLFGTSGDLEMVKSPSAVLRSGRYDCDCIATLIAAMLISIGIKARFIVVGFAPQEVTGPDGFEHVYAQGYDEATGTWMILDPVSHPMERQMILDTKQARIYDLS